VLLPPLRGDLQRLALGSAADAALPEEVPRRDGRWLLTCVVRLSQVRLVGLEWGWLWELHGFTTKDERNRNSDWN